MNALAGAAPAIAMVAVFALVWGGAVQWRRDRRKGALMLVLAAVIFGNVLIATV